jgi:hypothetical protein
VSGRAPAPAVAAPPAWRGSRQHRDDSTRAKGKTSLGAMTMRASICAATRSVARRMCNQGAAGGRTAAKIGASLGPADTEYSRDVPLVRHRAGTMIRGRYGGRDGAAGGYRTHDLSLTKGEASRVRDGGS